MCDFFILLLLKIQFEFSEALELTQIHRRNHGKCWQRKLYLLSFTSYYVAFLGESLLTGKKKNKASFQDHSSNYFGFFLLN